MRDRVLRAAAFGGLAAASAAGFTVIAVASARRSTAGADRMAARKAHVAKRGRIGRVAELVAPIGTTYGLVPGALLVAGWTVAARVPRIGVGSASRTKGRRAGAAVVVGVMAVAAAVEPVLDRVLPQPPMPPGRSGRKKAVFPSGHALKSTAVGFAAAHVLVQEELVDARAASAVACALPVVNGGVKLLLGEHWLSDVAAGVLGGIALGALGCGVYELARA